MISQNSVFSFNVLFFSIINSLSLIVRFVLLVNNPFNSLNKFLLASLIIDNGMNLLLALPFISLKTNGVSLVLFNCSMILEVKSLSLYSASISLDNFNSSLKTVTLIPFSSGSINPLISIFLSG